MVDCHVNHINYHVDFHVDAHDIAVMAMSMFMSYVIGHINCHVDVYVNGQVDGYIDQVNGQVDGHVNALQKLNGWVNSMDNRRVLLMQGYSYQPYIHLIKMRLFYMFYQNSQSTGFNCD